VLGPPEESLRVSPLTGSPKGSATAELFHAGLGLPQDYPAGGIGGKIALVQRGQIEFGEKLRNAAAAGASAIVIYDPPNDVFPGRLSGQIPGIPALVIPGKDGVRLREQLASGPVRATLAFDGGYEELTATNVIGRPPGKGCAAVVGGHFDSVENTPGASDNASGTAAVLEMARVQALRGNPEQACFIAFSGEELGLLGSIHYVQQLSQAERQAIKFMINMDMVAVGDEWLFIGSQALVRRGQEIAESLGISGRRSELMGASSDHAAFIDRRIPAIMLHRSNDTLLHTPQDTPDRITAPPLETAVRLGLAWLAGLAQS
jgi:aminopeptidase YwaD